MSASDHLSNELFFTAHRGLHSDNVVGQNVGMHWTANKSIAEHFSQGAGHRPKQTVVTANIPISSVETNTGRLFGKGVVNKEGLSLYSHEEEVPVKYDAPVFVTSISRKGNWAENKSRQLENKLSAAMESGNPEKLDLPAINRKSNEYYERSEKRNRRITKRFNPPKEMKA